MTSKQIRQEFLDFFRGKEHTIVPSSPVVPFDDPTLMFTNAGMNQFKDVFLGTGSRAYKRAANTQKCIRAGGKHNDLDDVGQDTYHHTFFEMLGNWSFGDYFKKEAIAWAWELLTKVWGIDKTRLHATYFGGIRKATEPRSHEATKMEGTEGNPSCDCKRAGQSEPGAQATGGPDRQSTIDNRQFPEEWELEPDYETRDLWASVTDIDPSHIHPGNMKDNFWEMGETGPCGPCSEIHIDLTPDKSGAALVNKGDARVMEIWNLVFIQFNRGSDSKLTPLPAKHVDTGMGFERLCAVLQGTKQGRIGRVSNYDTDVFTPIFAAIRERTGAPQYQGTLPDQNRDREGTEKEPQASACATRVARTEVRGTEQGSRELKFAARADQSTIDNRQSTIMTDVSYRVIADHLRCLTFALTDGAIPSNEGRGYVLRRILRRAVRYGRQYMNLHEPFLCDLVAPLVDHMAEAFSELRTAHRGKNVEHVADLIRDEEASFLRTIDRGISLFNDFAAMVKAIQGDLDARKYLNANSPGWDHPDNLKVFRTAGANVFPGKAIFILHDTYGFPSDLTQIMATERSLIADLEGYEREMSAARDRARAASKASSIAMTIEGSLGSTGDELKYWEEHCETRILGYAIGGTYFTKDAIPQGIELALVTERTCFYAEQGGQVGDSGFIQKDGINVFRIKDAKRHSDAVLHIGQLVDDSIEIRVGDKVWLYIDDRKRIKQNHTATHVLNWALREVLEIGGGGKVDQKGSLVDPEKTRFDFSHNKPLTDEELDRIEKLCNEQIAKGLWVYAANREEDFVDQKKAREINTLRAVFGEKYPDKVRVVSIGAPIIEEDAKQAGESDWLLRSPNNPKWMTYSVEFCGGTHVKNTSEIEHFVLTHEEGVAKGIRRVVGISGEAAKAAEALGAQLLDEVRSFAQTEPQASACATTDRGDTNGSRGLKSAAREDLESPRGLKSAAQGNLPERVADFQKRLAEAEIPIRTRREIQAILVDVQKALKKYDKESAAASGEAAMDAVAALLKNAQTIGGVTVVIGEVPAATPDALRGAIDWVRNKTTASAVLLATVSDNKVTLIAGMSKAVVERGIKAGDLIKEICPLVGGKGGGRPDMAQGGGSNPGGLPEALQFAIHWVSERLDCK